MEGSLIGCWYTDTFNPVVTTPSGVIVATGVEHFVGCLDVDRTATCAGRDPSGTLAFAYRFEGKFDPVTDNEISGRCQHRIVSGTRGFSTATSRIDFKDNVTNGTSNYRGHITLANGRGAADARAAAATAAVAIRPKSIC
jgi:hypothetical protein